MFPIVPLENLIIYWREFLGSFFFFEAIYGINSKAIYRKISKEHPKRISQRFREKISEVTVGGISERNLGKFHEGTHGAISEGYLGRFS